MRTRQSKQTWNEREKTEEEEGGVDLRASMQRSVNPVWVAQQTHSGHVAGKAAESPAKAFAPAAGEMLKSAPQSFSTGATASQQISSQLPATSAPAGASAVTGKRKRGTTGQVTSEAILGMLRSRFGNHEAAQTTALNLLTQYGVAEECCGGLSDLLGQLQQLAQACPGAVEQKAKMLGHVAGGVAQMRDTFRLLEDCEEKPSPAQAAAAVEADNGVKPTELVEMLSKQCVEQARVLREGRCMDAVLAAFLKLQEKFATQLLEQAEREAVIVEASLRSREGAVHNLSAKLQDLDESFSRSIGPSERAVVSVMLDAVLEPSPAISKLVAERRAAKSEVAMAESELLSARALQALAQQARVTLRWIMRATQNQINTSMTRGARTRSARCAAAQATLLSLLPKLKRALMAVASHEAERRIAAAKRQATKAAELEEHKRLFDDSEAPSERRELERRVKELAAIPERCRQALAAIGKSQRELWVAICVSERKGFKPHELQALLGLEDKPSFARGEVSVKARDRCLLPDDVVLRLGRCMKEVAEQQRRMDPECPLAAELDQIVEAAVGFIPGLLGEGRAAALPPKTAASRSESESQQTPTPSSSPSSSSSSGMELAVVERNRADDEMQGRLMASWSASEPSKPLMLEDAAPEAFPDTRAAQATFAGEAEENNGRGCTIS